MIPLPHLPTTIQVVRLAETSDYAGGPTISHEVPVYDSLCVRFTIYGGRYPDPDRQQIHGHSGKRLWKILSEPARALQFQDRLKVPWGNVANWEQPLGLPNNFYPNFSVLTPDLRVGELFWRGDRYVDEIGNFSLHHNGTRWIFLDPFADFVYEFDTTYNQYCDVTAIASLWDIEYDIVSRYGPVLDYRVVQFYHSHDQCGQIHHTIILAELECDSPAKQEALNPIWQ